MTDRITLTGLRAHGRHGVYDFERERGQDFVVDAVLELDLAPAARSDDVTDTVHYGELADRLVAVLTGEPVNLIETLADRLLGICLADPRVVRATVTVHKPEAPVPHAFTDVAVTMTRTRPGPPAHTPSGGPASTTGGPVPARSQSGPQPQPQPQPEPAGNGDAA